MFLSLLENKKKDTLKVELELRSLKDKYNSSVDTWNKEKIEMQVNNENNFNELQTLRNLL